MVTITPYFNISICQLPTYLHYLLFTSTCHSRHKTACHNTPQLKVKGLPAASPHINTKHRRHPRIFAIVIRFLGSQSSHKIPAQYLQLFYNEKTMAHQDQSSTSPYTHVQFDTTMGTFVVELYHRHTPRTCYNMAALAEAGYYNNTVGAMK